MPTKINQAKKKKKRKFRKTVDMWSDVLSLEDHPHADRFEMR